MERDQQKDEAIDMSVPRDGALDCAPVGRNEMRRMAWLQNRVAANKHNITERQLKRFGVRPSGPIIPDKCDSVLRWPTPVKVMHARVGPDEQCLLVGEPKPGPLVYFSGPETSFPLPVTYDSDGPNEVTAVIVNADNPDRPIIHVIEKDRESGVVRRSEILYGDFSVLKHDGQMDVLDAGDGRIVVSCVSTVGKFSEIFTYELSGRGYSRKKRSLKIGGWVLGLQKLTNDQITMTLIPSEDLSLSHEMQRCLLADISGKELMKVVGKRGFPVEDRNGDPAILVRMEGGGARIFQESGGDGGLGPCCIEEIPKYKGGLFRKVYGLWEMTAYVGCSLRDGLKCWVFQGQHQTAFDYVGEIGEVKGAGGASCYIYYGVVDGEHERQPPLLAKMRL